MAGFGLILGATAAGGLQGGGEAGRTAVASMQEAQQKEDLVKMQEEMETQKDIQIAALNQGYHVQNTATDFANATTAANAQRIFEGGQGNLTRANAKEIAGMQTGAEIQSANIRVGGETAAAKIAADASMTNTRLMAMAHSVQTLGDGRIVATSFDPDTHKMNVTPLMDPSDPNKPLMGVKNIDQQHLLMAQNLSKMAMEYESMGLHDQATALMQQSNDVLSGKLAPQNVGQGANKVAPPAATQWLTTKANATLANANAYDQKYGLPPGTGATLISQAGIALNTPTMPGAAPASGSGYPAVAAAGPGGAAYAPVQPPLPPSAGATPPVAPTKPAAGPAAAQATPVQMPTGTPMGYGGSAPAAMPINATQPAPVAQTAQGTPPTMQGVTAAPGAVNWAATNAGLVNSQLPTTYQ